MVEVAHIVKSFGPIKVFDNFTLEFPEGKITVILGPSGCGKTTLLNMLAGLVKPDRGTISLPKTVSYLFQEPRLLPWLTVWDNLALVLRDKMPETNIRELVEQYLAITGITDYAHFYPGHLSGGLRQRVAMARAFAYQAPVLLMDEPFRSLDIKMRYSLIQDFRSILRKDPRTVVIVTHNIKEAVTLGDEIVVFSDKPVRILKKMKIEVPVEEREKEPSLVRIEQEMYDLLCE